MFKWMLPCLLLCFSSFLVADTALEYYQKGEQAKSVEERKEAFNHALTLYHQYETANPSAKLCFNIANTYFQLGEYGYAALYYYKALKDNPRDEQIRTNLDITLKKAGVAPLEPSFIPPLSHNEKVGALLVILFIIFILASLAIWLYHPLLKVVAIIFACLGVLLFAHILWTEYFTRARAVIVRPTVLRRDAGEQYVALVKEPCIPAAVVIVEGLKGDWMHVRLSSGAEGYIPKESARLI